MWSSVLYVKSNWDNRGTLVQVSPLSWAEWKIVLYLSFPVSTGSTLLVMPFN